MKYPTAWISGTKTPLRAVPNRRYYHIAIRHIDYDNKGYDKNQDKEVLNLKEILNRRNYNISVNAWIGKKLFSQFGNNDNKIIEGICKEIKDLKEEIQKI